MGELPSFAKIKPMSHIKLSPSILAQWHELVKDAQKATSTQLNEDLENYLILMLESFVQKTHLANTIAAQEFLEACSKVGSEQQKKLREVADKCLLFSGLFPQYADKQVSISYFVTLGRQSYHALSAQNQTSLSELFHALGLNFVMLMDVLLAMRELSGNELSLTPLQAEELWRVTNSKHALDVLKHYTQGIIILSDEINLKKKH